jgi:hypothetical protein
MKISEKTVAFIWQHQLVSGLKTVDGGTIEVCYPGRHASGGGCDFSDAVFYCGRRQVCGNVEVHVKSSYWYRHGHHKDPKYDKVSLHVVMWHDCSGPTILHNGNSIPILALFSFLTAPLKEENNASVAGNKANMFFCSEAKRYSSVEDLVNVLDRAGEKRFEIKMNEFYKELAGGQEAERVLMKYVARALGYMNNVTPFEKLSRILLSERFMAYLCLDILSIQAIIIGIAGLLPSQRTVIYKRYCGKNALYINTIERIWRSLGHEDTMNEQEWRLFSMRPQNHPVRRQIALACLIARYRDKGMVDSLTGLINTAADDRLCTELREALQVESRGYWMDHVDFGIALKHGAALLGGGRAGEITVNVVLPFIAAWSRLHHDTRLQERSITAYKRFPRLENNYITRHMKEQLFCGTMPYLNAARQQGLIHIYRTSCRQRDCAGCVIAQV